MADDTKAGGAPAATITAPVTPAKAAGGKPAAPPADDQAIADAKAAAKAKPARIDAAKAAADVAAAKAELMAKPVVALNRPLEDVLGNELPDDPDAARAQQRAAVEIRQARVEVDTLRTQRGLKPLYATE